jgi:hypothetical protein
MSKAGASLRPGDAATGGYLDATDVDIKEARFIDSYPNGMVQTLLRVTYIAPDGKDRSELYSCGKTEGKPSADGKYLVPDTARLSAKSGAMRFINSIIAAGFPEDRITTDVSVFDGARVKLARALAPKTGIAEHDAKNKEELMPARVLALPEENGKKTAAKPVAKKPVAAASKPAAAPAAVTPAVAEGDVEAEAVAIVSEILNAAPENTAMSNKIGGLVFAHLARTKNPRRAAIMKAVSLNADVLGAFLGAEGRPWAFDPASGEVVGYPVDEAA